VVVKKAVAVVKKVSRKVAKLAKKNLLHADVADYADEVAEKSSIAANYANCADFKNGLNFLSD
jgi:hypothetical protein